MTKQEWLRFAYEQTKPAYDALMKYYPFTLEDLDGEEWKPIAGFDGDYQISNYGRVKSFKLKTPRIMKPMLRGNYMRVELRNEGKRNHVSVHVLVATAFIPNPERKLQVNHEDGHTMNCHVSNLVWATQEENMQHAFKMGLVKSGINARNSKIKSETDIVYIRENPDNLTQKELAEMFGVSSVTIFLIQVGKRYPNAGGTIRQPRQRTPSFSATEASS